MMTELDTSNVINLGILVVTGLVGILTWLGSRRSAREARRDQEAANAAATRSADAAEEANKIQMRIVRLEEQTRQQADMDAKKASLVGTLERSSQFGSLCDLVVSNQGAAPARNLRIKLGGKPIDVRGSAAQSPSDCADVIGPGAQIRCLLQQSPSVRRPLPCELSWDDESGIPGTWKTTLT